jgi:hypothetical protein
MGDLLDDGEAVTDACVRAGEEREQVAEDTWHRLNSLWNVFPAFWSAGTVKHNVDASHARAENAHLNSSASSPHSDFNL